MCCSCRTVLFKIGSGAVVEMKTWAMPTDGARPWESVGGCSPLLWLKAFVCPLSPQPAMQGSRLAAAAAQRLQPPACLSTAPRRANIGYSERGGELFRIQPPPLAVRALLASGAHLARPRSRSPLLWAKAAPSQSPAVLPRDHAVPPREGDSSTDGQQGGGLRSPPK